MYLHARMTAITALPTPGGMLKRGMKRDNRGRLGSV
jgi:hypothetical protein